VFKWNGTRLVFLQVPGFKELQAFLHRQAFLQTMTGDLEAGSFQLSHETCSITDLDLMFLSCRLTQDLSFFKKSGLLLDFIISEGTNGPITFVL